MKLRDILCVLQPSTQVRVMFSEGIIGGAEDLNAVLNEQILNNEILSVQIMDDTARIFLK